MKKNLTKNIPLKIMSVIVGILVWLIVVNVDDPIITKGFVISDVQIINEAYVDQLGQMVMQDDSENTVRVYITGERKTVNRLTSSDIKAVADLQQAQSTDTDPVMIPITATCAGVLPENIRVSPQNLSVHLEKKVTKEFAINVSCGDSKPAQGLEIASLTAMYLDTYGHLPDNYMTKEEARALGWEGGSVEAYQAGAAIGGDRFGNREGLLPEETGRTYTECDINTLGADSRGAERLIFSNDGLYFYTSDHYASFTELTVDGGTVIWN